MVIHEVDLDEGLLSALLSLSKAWEDEYICRMKLLPSKNEIRRSYHHETDRFDILHTFGVFGL